MSAASEMPTNAIPELTTTLPLALATLKSLSIEAAPIAAPATPPLTPNSCLSVTPANSTPSTPATPSARCQPVEQQTPPQLNSESDSGKSSSCSPALLDCSFDSGIGVMDAAQRNDLALQKRIQQCKRILLTLERDKHTYHQLRLRLSKIAGKNTHKEEQESEDLCNVCCAVLNLKDIKSYVTCCTCKKYICRGIKCADWLPKDALWQCQLCHSTKESMAQTSSWVAEQMSFNQQKCVYPMRARSEIFIPISDFNDSQHMQFESVSQVGGSTAHITADQKLKIREYVEEIVAQLLGGSLDKVSVGQLSKSENYLPALVNGHNVNHNNASNNNNNNNNDSIELSDISQTRLRQLIASIIAETVNMPAQQAVSTSGTAVSEIALDHQRHSDTNNILRNGSVKQRRHRTEHYFEPTVYQDLLATAVLNKIVDNQSNARHLADSTPNLNAARHVDENYNVENQSILSGSSVEPRSDCSYSDPEHELQESHSPRLSLTDLAAERESVLSDYVASHMVPLPELSTANVSETEEDDYASVTSSAVGEGTWEDNWLFKKKRSPLQSSVSASTMSMLVPAPKEDVRAQIGDKTTDEISDLSEMGSDTDDSSLDVMRQTLIEPMNDRFLNKQLIGGQNTKMVLDELIECASVTSNTLPSQNEPPYTETANENVLVAVAEAINNTVNAEQTDFAVLPPPSEFQDLSRAPAHLDEDNQQIQQQLPLPGSIAERECKKWYNAVEMPNNPYAPEALKRRISGKQERLMDIPNISPTTEQNPIKLTDNVPADISDDDNNADIKRYSRDYYINDGKLTPGSSQRSPASPTAPPAPTTAADTSNTFNEVIAHGTHHAAPSIRNDNSQWHLSKPVRRSSSLQYLANTRYSPARTLNCHSNSSMYLAFDTPNDRSTPNRRHAIERPATSASLYRNHMHNAHVEYDDDDGDGARSQRSWQSASIALNTLPKRRTLSTLSVHSNASGTSYRSHRSQTQHSGASAHVLTQFEKQLLHKDLKRNSFRAVSATTKDFVVNPLFDQDKFFGADGKPKLSVKHDAADDSGVDSCLNGCNDVDAKASNNSLLF